MKLFGVFLATIFLSFALAAPTFAQDAPKPDRQDEVKPEPKAKEAKPPKEEAPKANNHAQDQERHAQDQQVKQQQKDQEHQAKDQQKQQQDHAKQQERNQQNHAQQQARDQQNHAQQEQQKQQDKQARDNQKHQQDQDRQAQKQQQEQQRNDQRNRDQQARDSHNNDQAHYHQAATRERIPDDKFRAHFGREHHFRVGHPTIVDNQPRFQYSGYSFEFAQPWPADWSYDDDCYIDYVDDGYYLFDPVHPGVQIALNIVF